MTAMADSNANAPLLSVRNLSIAFPGARHTLNTVVNAISFDLCAGESLAVVGESGSGKTMIGKALLGLLPDAARITGGSASFQGRDLLAQPAQDWLATRGTQIGMVFQEPMVSLNPAFRIGDQLTEALVLRRGLRHNEARDKAVAMLERVKVHNVGAAMQRYPHEFSGGMRQRILLAAVMLLKPKLLIADEPTTALDCVVQKEVLELMMELTRAEGTALLFISHNLALVAAYTQRVLVMKRGEAMETGAVADVLSHPSHPYTLNLLDALPKRGNKPAVPATATAPILEVRGLAVDYHVADGWFRRKAVRAVHDASFQLAPGETLAIVGESGSGKTTIMKAILGLAGTAEGEILLHGRNLAGASRATLQAARHRVQMVFQDPYSALDPRMRIEAIVGEGLHADRSVPPALRRERVLVALADVGLDAGYASRHIHELSGGQRQRVAIARALVMRPDIVIADEPVSALDVTVQKQVLDTLTKLQRRYGFACLLISHDLGVVEQVADRVIVMLRGHAVEQGTRDAVFDRPTHPYTQRLLQAVPELRGSREAGFRIETRAVLPNPGGPRRYYDPSGDAPASRRLVAAYAAPPAPADARFAHLVAVAT
ncbi:ABC transporter ATP-binding protein [Cupriavidus basilensis]|uniref:ABC transporter ATP-binding protein n=1 Tax=Cupriavidus basilensis TaxID=68895 RepID=UPI00283DF784|nr:ABC transporter ATP-binding protein [Cupriavidus basilensis]MDR3383031.1 ABC transporter ATP-binding protein [Cupriavidus basilensis]